MNEQNIIVNVNSKTGGGYALSNSTQIGGRLVDKSVNFGVNHDEDLAKIMADLESLLDKIPERNRKDFKFGLEDLDSELKKVPEKREPEKVNYHLRRLVGLAGGALMSLGVNSAKVAKVASSVDDTLKSVRSITEEVQRIKGNPTEFKALSPSNWEAIKTVKVFSDGIGQIAEAYQLTSE